MPLAPIVLFVYNRPDHTRKTLEALAMNLLAKDSTLYIYSDGPKEGDMPAVQEVRDIIGTTGGFKEKIIVQRTENQGLAKSIIQGVSDVLKTHGKVIVLEDDIVTTPNFLTFMNDCLEKYRYNEKIFSVTGYALPVAVPVEYSLPVYLSFRGSSWGWGTWDDRWMTIDWEIKDRAEFVKHKSLQKTFDQGGSDLSEMLTRQIEGRINSWAIRFAYNASKQGKFHITPVRSKVQNIGHDRSGVHSGNTKKYDVNLDKSDRYDPLPDSLLFNKEINDQICAMFKKPFYKTIIRKILGLAGVKG